MMTGVEAVTTDADDASPSGVVDVVGDLTSHLEALATTSGEHRLPPGRFLVRRTIRLGTGVSIIGSGNLETTLVLADGVNDNMFTNQDHVAGNADIGLANLRMEGNGVRQWKPESERRLSFCNGVYLANVTRASFQDITLDGFKQTGLHFRMCESVRIRNYVASDLGWSGISTSGTVDIVAESFYIYDTGHDHRHSAIHLDGGGNAFLRGVVRKCVGNGVMLDASYAPFSNAVVRVSVSHCMRGVATIGSAERQPEAISVVGGSLSDNEVGVLVSNSRWVHVHDVDIRRNSDVGIRFQGRVGGRESFVVGCRFADNAIDVEEIHASGGNFVTDLDGEVNG